MKESLVQWKFLGLKELLALKESKVLKESLVLKFIHIAETRDIYLNISNFTCVCPASVSMSCPVPNSEFHATQVLH